MPRTAPNPTRQASRVGSLAASATWLENEERLWDTVEFMPDLCVAGALFEPCDPPENKTIEPQDGPTTAPVHGMWEGAVCSTGASDDEISLARERASRALDISYVSKVEEALWTGGVYAPITDASALASTAADDLTVGGALGVVPAFAAMVDALNGALGGARGMIHGTQGLAVYLTFYGLLNRNGNILQVTNTDHVYVAGTGYDGSDPDGGDPAAGFTWIYGTGPVTALVSAPFFTGNINTSDNSLEVRAERAAAAYFSPCAHFAAEVCLPDPGPECAGS